MKEILIIVIMAFISISCYSQEIESTAKGGDWNDPATWADGKVPDSNSDVIIKGNVIVKESFTCKNLKIIKEGTLELGQIEASTVAKISETLDLIDGTIIIQDKWKLFVNKIVKTEDAIINNLGIIKVGY